jgi:hypothetical protein
VTDLATLTVRLEAEIGKYQENLEKATRQLKRFSDDSESLLSRAASGFAALFTVDKAFEWGKAIIENADHLEKFSQSTGIAVAELSRIQFAMKASGVDGEALGLIFRKLNENISEAAGNSKSKSAVLFRDLGIDVRDSTGAVKSADVVLRESANSYSKFADGANKSALSVAEFGRQGDALIPFLNQGADGIAALENQADKLGATLDGATAKAAEKFNDRLGQLKVSLFDGIGNRIAKDLLPTLDALADRWTSGAHGAEVLDNVARGLATGLRLLVDAGIIVGNIFSAIGRAIGAVAAAIVQVVQGNFSQAGQIITDYYDDTKEQTKSAWGDIKTTWADGTAAVVKTAETASETLKHDAPNLAGGIALQEAADKAIEKLKLLEAQIRGQVATFDQGAGASTKYRLETGDLAQTVKDAGAAGEKYAASIIKQADALERLKDTKDIEKALQGVSAEILQLQGNTADAVIAQFDAQYAELFTKIRRTGSAEAEKQLAKLVELKVAQSDLNALNEKAAQIEADLASTEERLNNSRLSGATTELAFQEDLSAARTKAAADLAKIAETEEKIAKQTGNPEQAAGVQRLTDKVAELRAQSDLLEKSLRKSFEDSLSGPLKDFIKGTKSAGDAFQSFVDGAIDALLNLATQWVVTKLTTGLFGTTSSTPGGGGGGLLGNIFGSLAGAFAGGRAEGGDVMPGMAYRVNEKSGSEWFAPRVAGRIMTGDQMSGGQQVTNYFSIQAPQGTVSRQTQLQIAAAAAKGLGGANRRNN